jgi:hypothetical protein
VSSTGIVDKNEEGREETMTMKGNGFYTWKSLFEAPERSTVKRPLARNCLQIKEIGTQSDDPNG